jgi:molybdopterin-guanine dinucleotide biosynthesis protein A
MPRASILGLVLAGGLARRMGGGDKTRIHIGGKTILAGMLAGLDWAAVHAPAITDVVSVPGDCPFLPGDLVARLSAARSEAGSPFACARSGEWRHPVVGLWPVALREDLRKALVEENLRKIESWTARHGIAVADWPATPVDPFFNVNTPGDAAEAERIAEQQCDV